MGARPHRVARIIISSPFTSCPPGSCATCLLTRLTPLHQAADAHVGQVRDFSAPSAPQAPAVPSSSDLSSELDAYAKSEPDTAEKASSSSSAAPDASNRQTAEQFLEEAARDVEKEAHH